MDIERTEFIPLGINTFIGLGLPVISSFITDSPHCKETGDGGLFQPVIGRSSSRHVDYPCQSIVSKTLSTPPHDNHLVPRPTRPSTHDLLAPRPKFNKQFINLYILLAKYNNPTAMKFRTIILDVNPPPSPHDIGQKRIIYALRDFSPQERTIIISLINKCCQVPPLRHRTDASNAPPGECECSCIVMNLSYFCCFRPTHGYNLFNYWSEMYPPPL